MSHHTQKTFKKMLDQTRLLIIQSGGIFKIEKDLGLVPFSYYVSSELGCLPKKAVEYFNIVKHSAIAEERLKKMKEVK